MVGEIAQVVIPIFRRVVALAGIFGETATRKLRQWTKTAVIGDYQSREPRQ